MRQPTQPATPEDVGVCRKLRNCTATQADCVAAEGAGAHHATAEVHEAREARRPRGSALLPWALAALFGLAAAIEAALLLRRRGAAHV